MGYPWSAGNQLNAADLNVLGTGDYQNFTVNGTWTKPTTTGLTGSELVLVRLWGAGGGKGQVVR